jgi:hypothetical protein
MRSFSHCTNSHFNRAKQKIYTEQRADANRKKGCVASKKQARSIPTEKGNQNLSLQSETQRSDAEANSVGKLMAQPSR